MSEIDAVAELREWVRRATLAWSRAEEGWGTDPRVVEAERKHADALLDQIESDIAHLEAHRDARRDET